MQKFSHQELKEFLESKFIYYNNPSFVKNDPILIPHSFSKKEDQEIAGFLTAVISWGKRKAIINSGMRFIQWMDNDPSGFVKNFSAGELNRFNHFVHRTFNSDDCKYFLAALKHIYLELGGLEKLFIECLNVHNDEILLAISDFRKRFFQWQHLKRSEKHLGDPIKNSTAKRFLMFLRWMVRKDGRGVDFGIWNISPSQLAIPLDVHSARVARKLGLLTRSQNDWKAVIELTNKLREFDANDPVKYDFALFGLGVNEQF